MAALPAGRSAKRVRCQTRPRASTSLPVRVSGSGLVLGFGLPPPNCGAEDIAEAGTGFGGAELLHGPLLFVHLARLDRQRDAPGRAVALRDLGVDPLADRKTVGALLAAVARQLGFADEAGHIVGQHDLDPGIVDTGDRAGDDLALLQLDHALFERVGFELFDAEADPLLLDIDVQYLDPHHLALAIVLDGVFAGLVPVDVGEMDHAVDIAGQADEQAELGDVADFALDNAADRVLFGEGLPRVRHDLLQAEADAALLRVDVEHHDFDLLRGRDDLAGMHVLLGPAHLRNMDEPLDARLEFNERAVIGDVRDAALELGAGRIFQLDALPRVSFELFHAEGNPLRLRIEADHLHL